MTDKAASIAKKIDRLDHPDAGLQDVILDEFSREPETARPVVLANLPLVNARIRRALLRWLDGVLTTEATLPLMRYVFDERGSIPEQTGRAMAMGLLLRRARLTDLPEERGRLRAFAEDLCRDEDPDVRRRAVEILCFVGNYSSIPFIEPHANDDDAGVRRSVRRTLNILADAPDDDEGPQRDPDQLLNALLNSAGPRRNQLVRRWTRHEERASIALGVLRHRGELRERALQILIEEPKPEARPFLASMVLEEPDSGLAALSLRLLAKLGESGDAKPDEITAIRSAFRSRSVLSRAASFAAIQALGLDQFAPTLVELSESHDLSIALPAAQSLDGLVNASHHELSEPLRSSLRTNELRRRGDPKNNERVRIVAHLLSALNRIVTESTIGVELLHRTVFEILSVAGSHRPIRIKAIELLMTSTPEAGLDDFERWDATQVSTLINLLAGASRPAVQRIARLLCRGAPQGMAALESTARKLWKTGYVDMAQIIVPLLERANSEDAKQWLATIADGEDPRAAGAARAILRRDRNARDVIDAEFIPRNED